MDNKSKRIGTFKQFLNEQRIQKIKEAMVSLEVEWWDSCILEIMQILSDECGGILEYENLVNYVKGKFQIMGKPDPGYDEGFLLQHIKDLIFQLHGDSFVCDGLCSWGDTSEIQAKGLVVSELAKVILDKVLETIKTSDDPIPGETRVSLVDKEPRTLVPMAEPVPDEDEYYEDLPYEYESHKVKPVKGFYDYTKKLNETVAMIDVESEDECIRFCLDLVKKNVGSLDPVEILDVALQEASAEVKLEVVKNYFRHMIYDYLCNEKGQVKIVGIGDPKDVQENVPEEVFEQGLEILCDDIADAVIDRLAEENGFGYEKV